MYTKSQSEKDKLNRLLATVVLPALKEAIDKASRELVYEVEGFHPDVAYGENLDEAADEMTMLLCDYFAGISYMSEENMHEKINQADLYDWLRTRTDSIAVVELEG